MNVVSKSPKTISRKLCPAHRGAAASQPARDAGREAQEHDKVDISGATGPGPRPSVYATSVSVVFGAGALLTAANVGLAILSAGTLGPMIGTGLLAAAGLAGGYLVADAASAVFHWAVDNYPDGNTPIIGKTADEFQIHHKNPLNLEEGHLLDNIALAGQFTALPMLAVAAVNPPVAAAGMALGFLGGVTSAQASHRWAHMKRPNKLTQMLQGNVLQAKTDHTDHHAQPHAGHYGIVNGLSNPLFDKTHFFRKAEKLVYDLTGKEPHTWKDSNLRAFALGEISEEEFSQPANRAAGRKAYREAIEENYKEIEARASRA
jgi:ubiquitin-conjugating enzyme E2 variant